MSSKQLSLLLLLIFISQPIQAAITELGSITDESRSGTASHISGVGGIFITDNKAYVTSYSDEALSVFDVSSPSSISELGFILDDSKGGPATQLDAARGIWVANSKAYVTSNENFSIFDVSDSANISQLGSISDDDDLDLSVTLGSTEAVIVQNNTAYVHNYSGSIAILDVSDPTNISQLTYISAAHSTGFDIAGNTLAFVANEALKLYDISSPASPSLLGAVTFSDSSDNYLFDVALSGNYAYAVTSENKLIAFDISNPNNITEAGRITDNSIGGSASYLENSLKIAVADNKAFIASRIYEGSQFLSGALNVFDISDPTNITELGNIINENEGGSATRLNTATELFIDSNNKVYVAGSPYNFGSPVSLSAFSYSFSGSGDDSSDNSSENDTTAPTISTRSPAVDATNVDLSNNIEITFNETVQAGAGNIIVYRTSDNSILEAINVTSSKVTISGSSVTINPSSDFSDEESIYITIDSGFVTDTSLNYFAGITDSSWTYSAPVTEEGTEEEEDTAQEEEEVSNKSLTAFVRSSKKGNAPTTNFITYKPYFLALYGLTNNERDTIKTIEWDYEGDGTFDQTYTSYDNINSSRFVYKEAGTVNPSVKITYNDDSSETVEIGNSEVEEFASVTIKDPSGNEITEFNVNEDDFSRITVEIATLDSSYANSRVVIKPEFKSIAKVFKIKKKVTRLASENDTLNLEFKVKNLASLSSTIGSADKRQFYIQLRTKKKDSSTALVSIPIDLVEN